MREIKQIDFDAVFTEAEKDALALLVQRGFRAFTAARLEDVRELDGRRRRTFRNRGRYDLALMLRVADPDPGIADRQAAQDEAGEKGAAASVASAVADVRAEYDARMKVMADEHAAALKDLSKKVRAEVLDEVKAQEVKDTGAQKAQKKAAKGSRK